MTPDTAQPTVQVRPLQPAEWETVREARLSALAESPGAFFATLEQEQAYDEQKWRQRLAETAYFGAWEGGPQPRLIGLVATFPEAATASAATASAATASAATAGAGTASAATAGAGTASAATAGAGTAAGSAGTAAPAACWHLVAMWVSPDRRGRGIADRLVTAVCDLARARGAARVALWVADANPRAQAFYRRLGFAPSGERALLRAGNPDSGEARMTLDLGQRPGARPAPGASSQVP